MSNKRVYGQIGLGRLLDISVYLDNELIYDGMIEDAPDEIRKLKYSEIEVRGKVVYKVYSDMQ